MFKETECCFCGSRLSLYEQNNPEPLEPFENARCCDRCNYKYVIPIRIEVAEQIRLMLDKIAFDREEGFIFEPSQFEKEMQALRNRGVK